MIVSQSTYRVLVEVGSRETERRRRESELDSTERSLTSLCLGASSARPGVCEALSLRIEVERFALARARAGESLVSTRLALALCETFLIYRRADIGAPHCVQMSHLKLAVSELYFFIYPMISTSTTSTSSSTSESFEIAPDHVVILYASETGNAQDVAERVGREFRRLGRSCVVLSMDTFDIVDLPRLGSQLELLTKRSSSSFRIYRS